MSDEDDGPVDYESKLLVTADLRLSRRLLVEVTKPEWQAEFGPMTPQEVADHLTQHLVLGAKLTSLDGFAHLEDEDAVLVKEDWEPL